MKKIIPRKNIVPLEMTIRKLMKEPEKEHEISTSHYNQLVRFGIYQPLKKKEQILASITGKDLDKILTITCRLWYKQEAVKKTMYQEMNKIKKLDQSILLYNKTKDKLKKSIERKEQIITDSINRYQKYDDLINKIFDIKQWNETLIKCNNTYGKLSPEIICEINCSPSDDTQTETKNISFVTINEVEYDKKTIISTNEFKKYTNIYLETDYASTFLKNIFTRIAEDLFNLRKKYSTMGKIKKEIQLIDQFHIQDILITYTGKITPVGINNKTQITKLVGTIGDEHSFELKTPYKYTEEICLTGRLKYSQQITIKPIKKPFSYTNKKEREEIEELIDFIRKTDTNTFLKEYPVVPIPR